MGLLTTLLLVALPLLAAGALNTPGVQGSQSAIYLPLVMAPPYYRPVTASPQRALHRDRSRSRLRSPIAEVRARYEACEDLAKQLVEQAK